MSPRSPWAPTRPRTLKAFAEAEAYDGPSLIIAYAHCINHGINMAWA
jgi:pyruvate-ferredoxin/flavodoxin oxidoreductase